MGQVHSTRRDTEGGQIIVIFAFSLLALIALGALLFTGAESVVSRRQLQNSGDAAALAGANLVIQNGGCSASGDGGPPRAAIVTAARNSVATNMPGYNPNDVTVSCPAGYGNIAVRVDLVDRTPAFFTSNSINVGASSVAINGQVWTGDFAVSLLDPSNPNWSRNGNRTGCASYTVNGGITVTYEGDVFVDSACTLAESNNGAVKALNSAFSMSLINGALLKVVGEINANTVSKISPPGIQHFQPAMPDPLAGLTRPCSSGSDPAVSTGSCVGNSTTLPARTVCNKNTDPCVLLPGTYTGGIVAGSGNTPATILLRPGVYFIKGGGVQLKSSSARILSIPLATGQCGGQTCTDNIAKARYAKNLPDTTITSRWLADCPTWPSAGCGVLIYNAPANLSTNSWTISGANADRIDNGSQGIFQLRAYDATADSIGNGALFGSHFYSNLSIWQARLQRPSATKPQPDLGMAGGACVIVSGTVYAPGALINFGGSTCGASGAQNQMLLQFVSWDLTLSGDNNFYFAYRRGATVQPLGYGLIQ